MGSMKIIVAVTEDHIRNGVKCDPFQCAMGLALHDAGFVALNVDSAGGYNSGSFVDGTHLLFSVIDPQMREILNRFIVDFDAGRSCKPVTFELSVSTGSDAGGKPISVQQLDSVGQFSRHSTTTPTTRDP